MCEFISWIESNDGKTLLYLTDKEVFSEEGKKKLGDCRDNDILGHGAIRRFYGLRFRSGRQKEVRDFWNIKKLPKEIADKIRTIEAFDKYFGKMFASGVFQNDDLQYMINNAPDNWKEKACEQLLNQNPMLKPPPIINGVREYKARDGCRHAFSATPEVCEPFGFLPDDIVITPSGNLAIVIGVYDNNLWFNIAHDNGASYWAGYKKDNFTREGFKVLKPKTA